MLPITKKGHEALKIRLNNLKREFEKMPAVIAQAREKGDLKENAEYHAAKERQGMLNADINRVSSQLAESQIVDPLSLPKDIVTFGKKIQIQNQENDELEEYLIVGPTETNSDENKISVTSLLIKGLLGKKKGETVNIEVPSGKKVYKILEIETFI